MSIIECHPQSLDYDDQQLRCNKSVIAKKKTTLSSTLILFGTLIMKPDIDWSLNTSCQIKTLYLNNVIKSDLTDLKLEPELYNLVIKHQIHTCHTIKCGCPMTNNGQVCKKVFPQLYAPHTYYSVNELRYVTDVSLKNIDVCDTLSSQRLLTTESQHEKTIILNGFLTRSLPILM